MDDLVRWLGEQLDIDAAGVAAATWADDATTWHAAPSPYDTWGKNERWYVEDAMDEGVITHVDPQASDDEGVARHIAEHDPARVLREVEAKRKVVEQYERAFENRRAHPSDLASAGALLALHGAVKALASGYSHRPGYAEAIASAG